MAGEPELHDARAGRLIGSETWIRTGSNSDRSQTEDRGSSHVQTRHGVSQVDMVASQKCPGGSD